MGTAETRLRRIVADARDDYETDGVLAAAWALAEIDRLRAANAVLTKMVEDDPSEAVLEKADAAAHAWLKSVGRGHRHPAECEFGDGPELVLEEAKRLHAELAKVTAGRDAAGDRP